MSEFEGLSLNLAPSVPITIKRSDGSEIVYNVETDLDPITTLHLLRWLREYEDYRVAINSGDGAMMKVPDNEELFKLTAEALSISIEETRALRARACLRIASFLFSKLLVTMNIDDSSETPSTSPSNSTEQ